MAVRLLAPAAMALCAGLATAAILPASGLAQKVKGLPHPSGCVIADMLSGQVKLEPSGAPAGDVLVHDADKFDGGSIDASTRGLIGLGAGEYLVRDLTFGVAGSIALDLKVTGYDPDCAKLVPMTLRRTGSSVLVFAARGRPIGRIEGRLPGPQAKPSR